MANLYKFLVRPILTYSGYILLKADSNFWNRMQIMQNEALRATLGVPIYTSTEYIHNQTRIPKIKDHAIVLLKNAMKNSEINGDETTRKIYIR